MPIYLWEFENPLIMKEKESPNDRFLRTGCEEVTSRRKVKAADPGWHTYWEDVTPAAMREGNYRYEVLAFNDEYQTGIIMMRPNMEYPIGIVSSQFGKTLEFVCGQQSFALGPYSGTYRRRFPIIRQTHKGKMIERMILWCP